MRKLVWLVLCVVVLAACSRPGVQSPEWVTTEILLDLQPADAYVLAEEAEVSAVRKPLASIANRIHRISSGVLGREIVLVQSRDDVVFTDADAVALLEDMARQRAETYGMEYTVTTSAFYAAMIFTKDEEAVHDIAAICRRVFIGQPRSTLPQDD